MSIITNLTMDEVLSKYYLSKINHDVQGCCYEVAMETFMNIANDTINDMIQNLKSISIAYGYVGQVNEEKYRHCFLVINNTSIIDPTLFGKTNSYTEYHIFKLFHHSEFISLWKKFQDKYGEKYIPRFQYMIEEEKEYCNFAIKNKIIIEENNYKEFLEEYDINHEIITL
ncbi:TPA: hypothetical protein LA460_000302 [Clostridium botulinum]|nr:hypothetical protein [Clostridium botulinum]HBJ1652906.1 hypothetical protein [Clostridium botulinum]